ncbi:hypothetical protein KUTeg_018204 [Tegillarca granosa]|uniref:G-protein coupled receptors family 1 profile domain-containing protein n=1 Tax=Tegillarca granosa TaxID=220873 RepID=A0ABQ9EJN4_TEGGR|nr:hypothetical protein KUTeg_018204 [Tegillarca granosa]
MKSLQSLDTRGNDIYILERLFDTNSNLKLIYSDNFALCCITPKMMPADGCIAPPFDVSSCTTLIESDILCTFLWIIGILAVVGNICVFISRIKNEEGLFHDTFSILVGNLSVADSLIGVYLISIGIANEFLRGKYIWKEYGWRNSLHCSALGILSVLSSQVSVLTISFLTVARYLAVKFPFKEHKISRKNAIFGCVTIWMVSLIMGLFPYFAIENYYSVSGVCLSLPLTKHKRTGWLYSFLLFVVFNFLSFLFIAFAQAPIIHEVKKISSQVELSGKSKHIKVAKRLSLVILTDCLCWIPIGTMGLMVMFGYDMPRVIYAWTVVFVLPINSAINPFLYTFSDSKYKEFCQKIVKKRNI